MNKALKIGLWGLMLISVAILVWGFATGWPSLGEPANAPVNALLGWAYVMIGIAVACWVLVGLVMSAKNDPKSLVKTGIILAGAAVVCVIAYAIAPGSPAVGYNGAPVTAATLKLTDTLLTLTYLFGGAAIVAIVFGEIRMSVTNKK